MSVSISLCRPNELDPSLVTIWRSFQAERPELQHPFLSPEFVQLFAVHRPALRVAVIEEDHRTVGFFPFLPGSFGIGRAMGLGVVDAQAIVHAPLHRPDLQAIMKACRLNVLEFDHLVAYQGEHSAQSVVSHAAPFVDTTGDWDIWLANKKKENGKRISTGMQKQRKLAREHGELVFLSDSREPELLQQLMKWKSQQYKRTGRSDRFAQSWFRRLVEDVFLQHSETFQSRLSVLYAGDRVVGMDLSLLGSGVLAGWFPSYDTDLSHYSPGFVSMLEMLKAAMNDPAINRLDMGRGAAPYKESLKTGDTHVVEGWAQRPSLAASAWRIQTAPRRQVLALVLGNEKLRLASRNALNYVGSVRTRLPRLPS